jgi:hypothetical protein
MNERYALVGYAAVLGALLAVGTPDVQAYGYCCSDACYNVLEMCCPPQGGTADCSRDAPNYCIDTGGDWCS